METGQRQVGNKRTAKERKVEGKKKHTKKRNSKQSDRKKWRRSCLTQGNARRGGNIQDKTKRREDEDRKHRKRKSLGHTIIFTYQTPYVTCNSPRAELSREQDARPWE